MGLPTFDIPRYKTKLYSTGQEVEFRPFLVKEQKILLMAAKSSPDDQIAALQNIINACTFGKIDASKLASFDVEYLFLKIRSHSIGETLDLVLTCPNCGSKSNARLDLNSVKVQENEGHSNIIEVTPEISIQMRYPRITEVDYLARNNNVETTIDMIAANIESIWEGDTLFSASDYSIEEMTAYVEGLLPETLEKLDDFFATIPTLKHKIEWDCPAEHCKQHNVAVMEGIQSFFN